MYLTKKGGPKKRAADVEKLRQDFLINDLLTTSNQKLKKGEALGYGRSLILHHVPAKMLGRFITPAGPDKIATRAYIPELAALADKYNLRTAATRHNGCLFSSKGCRSGCLAWSGHGGISAKVQAARGRRTLAMISNPIAYARAIVYAVGWHYRRATEAGEKLALRLRGTDEGPPIGWQNLKINFNFEELNQLKRIYNLELLPPPSDGLNLANLLKPAGVVLYDYSKAPLSDIKQQRASGWHITASFTADKLTATRDGLRALVEGFPLAIPVDLAKGQPIPSAVYIEIKNGESVEVPAVDGDLSDYRPATPDGVAVILRTKKSRGADSLLFNKFTLRGHSLPQQLPDGFIQLKWN